MKFTKILKEVITTKAYAMARTIEQDPLQSFMFRVTIDADDTIGFQKVSGLNREVEVIEYMEGMYERAHKLAGRESVGEITLERGMYADGKMQNYYEALFKDINARHTISIQILDRVGNVRREFELSECWFSKFEIGDLDATSSDVIIETLTVQFEYFMVVQPTSK